MTISAKLKKIWYNLLRNIEKGDLMKKTDIILLSVIALFAIFGMLYVNKIQEDSILTDCFAFFIYIYDPFFEIYL